MSLLLTVIKYTDMKMTPLNIKKPESTINYIIYLFIIYFIFYYFFPLIGDYRIDKVQQG